MPEQGSRKPVTWRVPFAADDSNCTVRLCLLCLVCSPFICSAEAGAKQNRQVAQLRDGCDFRRPTRPGTVHLDAIPS